MASTGDAGGSLPPNFFLTPHQQSLLFAALNANNPGAGSNGLPVSPNSFSGSPMQTADSTKYQESPYLDNYDYDFGDSSFDFSFANGNQGKMIGDVPGTAQSDSTENEGTDGNDGIDGIDGIDGTDGNEGNEKRSHPDDDDDESSPGNDHKRRESSDRIPKKPGRKPLTSEPTSKRKAQNRAAQRAFRERKEKHLKDLETKVEELEKASEATNHENTKLRAQVERMNVELSQYKSRMALGAPNKSLSRDRAPLKNSALNNFNDVSFQFEFPKFGALPGPIGNKPQRSVSQPVSPPNNIVSSPQRINGNEAKSPQSQLSGQDTSQFKEDLAKFSGIFTPSMSNSTRNGSRASLDNFSVGAATSSPSASSNSNGAGPSSSCGTSPEPFTQSPLGFKPVETLTTIGEEQQAQTSSDVPFASFANQDFSSTNFDWLAQQHGGQFDPQLFGDYREPQNNILSNPTFDDFFNDTLDADFITPYNTATSLNLTATKKNLIDQIDAQQNSVDDDGLKKNMNCNQMWEKLQDCPKAQNGEFDLDGLCSELTKKAKCSGSGPVVGEQDFDSILKKYMGKDASSECMADKLGISLDRSAKANTASTS